MCHTTTFTRWINSARTLAKTTEPSGTAETDTDEQSSSFRYKKKSGSVFAGSTERKYSTSATHTTWWIDSLTCNIHQQSCCSCNHSHVNVTWLSIVYNVMRPNPLPCHDRVKCWTMIGCFRFVSHGWVHTLQGWHPLPLNQGHRSQTHVFIWHSCVSHYRLLRLRLKPLLNT